MIRERKIGLEEVERCALCDCPILEDKNSENSNMCIDCWNKEMDELGSDRDDMMLVISEMKEK